MEGAEDIISFGPIAAGVGRHHQPRAEFRISKGDGAFILRQLKNLVPDEICHTMQELTFEARYIFCVE